MPDIYGSLRSIGGATRCWRGERIGNQAFKDFISRNYTSDSRGCWYFQNGPRRVFVALAYAPLVVHLEGDALIDHCGRPFRCEQAFLDEEGSVLMQGKPGFGLLDDRDFAAYADRAQALPTLRRESIGRRFGFLANPVP